MRGLGKARPLTPDDGHEGSTLDGKRAHALRLGNDTGDTQTPPAVGDVAPIDGQVHELAAPAEAAPIELAAPADAPTEPLDPLLKPKPRAAATLAGGGGWQRRLIGVNYYCRSCCLTGECYRTFGGFQLTPTGPISPSRTSSISLFSAEAYTSCLAITPRHCLTLR